MKELEISAPVSPVASKSKLDHIQIRKRILSPGDSNRNRAIVNKKKLYRGKTFKVDQNLNLPGIYNK